MKKIIKQTMTCLLAASLAVTTLPMMAGAEEENTSLSSFIQEFQSPTKKTQANIRYWLKGAAVDEELVAADMKSIAEAGFSTVEVINKGGSSKDLSEYGWGTEEWQKASEIIIEQAELNGLSVDFTIGPTWPAAIPTLDVNDEAASQQLVYSVLEISASDFSEAEGMITFDCEVPEGPESETAQILVAVVFARLTGETRTDNGVFYSPGSGAEQDVDFTVTILDSDSLEVITPEEDGTIQLELPDGEEGDYLLFAFYSQGTGQTVSGSTDPDAVVVDHYSLAGTEALLNYWDEYILDDTLSEYFLENGGDLFEDSLELTTNVTPWTPDLLSYFEEERGYDLTRYLPLLINRFYSASASPEVDETLLHYYGFEDGSDIKVVEDFNELMNSFYEENHLKVINEWAEEHGLNYRVQAYSGYDTGHYDSNQAASVVGTIEGESLAFGESHDGLDSFRVLSGGAHSAGKQIISDELGAVVFGTYNITFDSLADLINQNAAGGVNQFVLHGYPASSEAESDEWPGYHPFGSMFGEAWDERQPVWDSMEIMTDYMARTQNILQEGLAKVDIAVYRDEKTIKTKYFDDDCLTVNGYSYEFLSDNTLLAEGVNAEDSILIPDSAAYQALVLYNETALSGDMAQKLIEFAENGLTIVIIGEAPDTGKFLTDSDEYIKETMSQLLSYENVYQIKSSDELSGTLLAANIIPASSYEDNAEVHSLHRESENVDFYWLYNYGDNNIELSADYVGNGDVYELNLWTGAITQLDSTSAEEGKISVEIQMVPGEAVVLMITEEDIPEAEEPAEDEEFLDIALTDNDWQLTVESYTAAAEGSSATQITEIAQHLSGLAAWSDIDELEIVSGTGVYQTEFLVDSLEGVLSAALTMKTGSGTSAITQVEVNGHNAGVIDQFTDEVDIAPYLTEGENTIRIGIATTLANAVNGTPDNSYGLLEADVVLKK